MLDIKIIYLLKLYKYYIIYIDWKLKIFWWRIINNGIFYEI